MLDNEIGFFSMLLREIKKGPKELFARLEKWLDAIFGYGQKVGDNALTEAQKNAKKLQDARELKRKRIEEARQDRQRMTNKSDGGQKFKKPVLQKMIKELEEKYQHIGLKVEVVGKNSGHKMIVNGKEVKRFYEWNKKGTLGAFAHHPPPPKLYIMDDCTKLTWQHEVWHLEDYAELGHDAYMAKKGWLREKTVWDKIWENRHMWTEKELVDSYDYYKMYALGRGGSPKVIKEMEDLCLKYPERVKYK